MYMLYKIFLFALFIISTLSYPNYDKIIVIADIHGDLKRFQNILIGNKVINEKGEWILERNSIVVQLGDQIDPKKGEKEDLDNHFETIFYTHYLKSEAIKKGSDFISLIGNHELMNIAEIRKNTILSNIISNRPIVLKINNYLFCHGIFKKGHYNALQYFNKNFDDVNNIWTKYVKNENMIFIEKRILNKLILDEQNSILYSRILDDKYNTLQMLYDMKLEYIFIGHIRVKKINVINNIWFLDLYLLDHFDNQRYSNIVIKNDIIDIVPLDKKLYNISFS